MFYTAQFDEVYYSQALDCFAVMESEDGALTLSSVVSERYVRQGSDAPTVSHSLCLMVFISAKQQLR